MTSARKLRVAVLIDLPRDKGAGGHVKYWERLAHAAAATDSGIDLTLYFSGEGGDEELSPDVRLRFLPPMFSSARLKFLPYVPAHTDLAPFHPRLAEELPGYDVIHTTDGFFAFAQTAERIARWNNIPLVTSFHTDTPAYTELFTQITIDGLLGRRFGGLVSRLLKIPARARASKERRLKKHLQACAAVLAMRAEDIALAKTVIAEQKILPMHLGVDKNLFTAQRQDRGGVMREYGIGTDKFMTLFVGRVDAGKNMPVLMQACAEVVAAGSRLHLIVAGTGPLQDEVKTKLGDRVTMAGTVEPEKLARLYASVDCLAITSEIEIGGMIGLEALAAGCPVLVSRSSGVAQLFGDTAAMKMIDSGVAAWKAALAALAGDIAQLSRMRDAAFMSRGALADWDKVLNNDFIPAWRKVAEERGAPNVR
jgi:glycosyltransferase involved in cell wall biosynthesis